MCDRPRPSLPVFFVDSSSGISRRVPDVAGCWLRVVSALTNTKSGPRAFCSASPSCSMGCFSSPYHARAAPCLPYSGCWGLGWGRGCAARMFSAVPPKDRVPRMRPPAGYCHAGSPDAGTGKIFRGSGDVRHSWTSVPTLPVSRLLALLGALAVISQSRRVSRY